MVMMAIQTTSFLRKIFSEKRIEVDVLMGRGREGFSPSRTLHGSPFFQLVLTSVILVGRSWGAPAPPAWASPWG
jgi:hypothetical protein